MALILRVEKRKLPAIVKDIYKSAETGSCEIFIPAIVCAEIGYISQKGRIKCTLQEVISYINGNTSFKIIPLDLNIVLRSFIISDIPELHDRFIAGTALELGLPLLSNDSVIMRSKFVETIW